MDALKHRFQEIASDANDARVELYAQLDYSDLIKLIDGTPIYDRDLEHKFAALGWRPFYGHSSIENRPPYRWSREWLENCRASQLLPAFYVFIKEITNT